MFWDAKAMQFGYWVDTFYNLPVIFSVSRRWHRWFFRWHICARLWVFFAHCAWANFGSVFPSYLPFSEFQFQKTQRNRVIVSWINISIPRCLQNNKCAFHELKTSVFKKKASGFFCIPRWVHCSLLANGPWQEPCQLWPLEQPRKVSEPHGANVVVGPSQIDKLQGAEDLDVGQRFCPRGIGSLPKSKRPTAPREEANQLGSSIELRYFCSAVWLLEFSGQVIC